MRRLIGAVACVLAAVTSAQAVSLGQRGSGQVLVYPYFTVNAGQTTFFSLVNDTFVAKALKVRFREGRNGRELYSINVYLDGFDVWTGALFSLAEGGPANLLTDDKTCTVPDLVENEALPYLDLRRYLPFQSAAYSGANADTGPTDLARTREGEIEVIEMGEIPHNTRAGGWVSQYAWSGRPRNCSNLLSAWGSGGYWSTNPSADLQPPGGGLYGTLAVVNPAQGTIFQVAATALDGFSAYPQHTAPGNAHPDLGDARSSMEGVQPPYADAEMDVQGKSVRARYIGAEHTIDAVSAVLMSDSLYNEYAAEVAAGANTDWVVSFPTKHHYADHALASAALPPFNEYFGEDVAGKSCAEFALAISDREGSFPAVDFNGPPPPMKLCYETSVISMLPSSFGTGSGPVSRVLASGLTFNIPPYASNGAMQLALDPSSEPHALRPAADGTVFHGLPAIGFGVVKYINGNVTPGVLANYSAVTPHRSTVTCRRGTALCQ